MKYFIDHWYETSGTRPTNISGEISYWLDLSEGSYVHIISPSDRGFSHDFIWEVVYQDSAGNWKEYDGEELTLQDAKDCVENRLVNSGYKRVDPRLRVME